MHSYALFTIKLIACLILCSFSGVTNAQNGQAAAFRVNQNETESLTAPIAYIHSSYTNIFEEDKNDHAIFSASKINKTNGLPPPYVIPVVFHIVSQNPSSITDLQIINAVKDLNDAFAHAGAYAGGPGANTGITFCLAQVDPNGGITNGITRTVSWLGNPDQDTEDGLLKALGSWDPTQYCNIWIVDSIKSEIYPTLKCGVWTRSNEGGYSGISSPGSNLDGIVLSSFGILLAHEMGHYLGLLHTFVVNSCTNNNCNTDGDGVCDTPPQSVTSGSCTAPYNSCITDTISGFSIDVPDLNSNFMSYSTCANAFTNGQTAKMINNLTTTRASLLAQNKCTPPCGENILASFTSSNWEPAVGTPVTFTSTSTGGTNFQWTVNGAPVGTGAALTQSFPAIGQYNVTLKVYNANPACYSSYSGIVEVNCGVVARFVPDKRTIASKSGVSSDSVLFTNRSIGGSTYKWLVSYNGLPEQPISSPTNNLNYVFPNPGQYTVRLIAYGGACSDTTSKLRITVFDPIPDAYLNFLDVECYQQTKIKVTIRVCNNGFGPMAPNLPLSFYDADPTTSTAHKIGSTMIIPDTVYGKCCGTPYDYILDVNQKGLNTIFAVINDDGTTIPIVLPNAANKQIESNYINDTSARVNFQFKVSVVPPSPVLLPFDTLLLTANGTPGTIASAVWSTAQDLSCTNCISTNFVAEKKDAIKKVVGTSAYGCIDSATVLIKVPPPDDYEVTIDTIACAANDSLQANITICNNYKRGVLPAGLKVSFYDGDPSLPNAHLLSPAFAIPAYDSVLCASFVHVFKGITGLGKIYAVVNDSGTASTPVGFPQDTLLKEKIYTNNITSNIYKPDTVEVLPSDTTVLVHASFPVNISAAVNPSSINWLPDSNYSLSCTSCASPVVTIFRDAVVKVQTKNQYGCILTGQANVKVIPPDMTIQLTESKCFTNDSLLVKFVICMSNGYDSVFKGIPVSFYDTDPVSGGHQLLGTYLTQATLPGICDTFTTVVKSPVTLNLFVVVNDKGQNVSIVPDNFYPETDLTNNINNIVVTPFTIILQPADTTVLRSTPVQMISQASGGQITSASWQPIEFLSCRDCPDPVARPVHSLQYKMVAQNEYSCTATATAYIRTYSPGDKVSIPNAFTPNGDGLNDVFFILASQNIKIVKDFSIFNRWGQKVFVASNTPPNDPSYGWNGTVGGKYADAGTYVYVVTVSFTDGQLQSFKGTVTLVR